MTNAQCVSGEENPNVEDIAVGMIITKVATDFHIEVDAEGYRRNTKVFLRLL